MKPPFVRDVRKLINILYQIKNDWDTKYFENLPEKEPWYPPLERDSKRASKVNRLC